MIASWAVQSHGATRGHCNMALLKEVDFRSRGSGLWRLIDFNVTQGVEGHCKLNFEEIPHCIWSKTIGR